MPAVATTPDGAPARLLRAFDERAYLQDFLSGKVRLQLHGVYRSIEDERRRDTQEGNARLTVPGLGGVDVSFGGSFHDPVYLLCCSDPAADVSMFGRWVVRINDPVALLEALGAASSPIPGRSLDEVRLLRVRYSKGLRATNTPEPQERLHLMMAQKPASFEPEREWRYVVMFSGPVAGAPSAIWLNVDNMRAIAAASPPKQILP